MRCPPSTRTSCAVCAATCGSAKSSTSPTGPCRSTCRASYSTDARANCSDRELRGELNQHLSGVRAAEQADQCRRRLFDALQDGASVLDEAFLEPSFHVGEKLRAQRFELVEHEAPHRQTVVDHVR